MKIDNDDLPKRFRLTVYTYMLFDGLDLVKAAKKAGCRKPGICDDESYYPELLAFGFGTDRYDKETTLKNAMKRLIDKL